VCVYVCVRARVCVYVECRKTTWRQREIYI